MWPPPAPEPPSSSPVSPEVGSVPLSAPVPAAPCIGPPAATPRGPSASVRLELGLRRLGPQPLDVLSAARQVHVGHGEVRSVRLGVKVAVGQRGPHSQPAWGGGGVRRGRAVGKSPSFLNTGKGNGTLPRVVASPPDRSDRPLRTSDRGAPFVQC